MGHVGEVGDGQLAEDLVEAGGKTWDREEELWTEEDEDEEDIQSEHDNGTIIIIWDNFIGEEVKRHTCNCFESEVSTLFFLDIMYDVLLLDLHDEWCLN